MSETVDYSENGPKGYKTVQFGPKAVSIPTHWEVVPLNQIASFKNGEVAQPKAPKGEHPITIYGSNGPIGTTTRSNFTEGLIIGRVGAVGEIHKIERPVWVSDNAIQMEINSEKTILEYIYKVLSRRNLKVLSTSTAQPLLNQSTVKSVRVPLPPLPEQRRIADILSMVDEQIQQTDDVIETTKKLKQGLMQNVFDINTTEKIGESKFLNNAQKESLGDLVEVISGVHVKSEHVTHDPSETPYLTGPADFAHRGFSVTKYTNKTSKFCEPGDTLVTVKGSGCGNSTFATQKAGISRQLKALRPSVSVDERYLYYYIQTKADLLSILAQGTSIPGLSTSDLTTLTIPLPKLDVQRQIGDIFETIDDQITIERERKQKLQELKRGLMQDLLTGKIRVDTD